MLPEVSLIFAILTALIFFILYLKERQQKKSFHEQFIAVRQEKEHYLNEKIILGNQLTEQVTRNADLSQKLKTQSEEQQLLQEQNRIKFENIANKVLEDKSEKFTKQNQSNLENLLKPLQERIKDFEKKVEDTYNRESRERFSLQNELKRTFELNQTLSEQATNLTKALKADTKKQGNWGEYILERILETSGLEEKIHFLKQPALSDEEGNKQIPDVVLLLRENKHVIIDAKVSLTAYERYYNSTNEAEQQHALQAHLRSVRKHRIELSAKNYERLYDHSPDFVLMFIPVEPAYALALMEDSRLFDEAFRKKVILVSISSLLATLRIIESIWRLEKQNRNASEIIEQGNKLYDKLVGFVENMHSLGQKLQAAQTDYDQAVNKLSTGKGNLIRRAEQMKMLGLNPSKQLSEEWTKIKPQE